MKNYSVLVTFPDVASAYAQQRVTVAASSFEVAIHRAVKRLRQLRGIKTKRLQEVQVYARVMQDERKVEDGDESASTGFHFTRDAGRGLGS